MNQIFKNSKKIVLDDNYHLIPDSDYGLILVFEEQRTHTKKDQTEEKFTFTDRWYQPRTSQILSTYLKLKLGEARDLEDIKTILEKVENKIDELKETW